MRAARFIECGLRHRDTLHPLVDHAPIDRLAESVKADQAVSFSLVVRINDLPCERLAQATT